MSGSSEGATKTCPFCAGKLERNCIKCPHCLWRFTDDVKVKQKIAPLSEWACSMCTFLNNASLAECEQCETPRPGAQIVKVARDEKSLGEKLKEGFNSIMSSAPKSTTAGPSTRRSNSMDTWVCKKCAYDCNPSWAKDCDICFNPKIGLKKSASMPAAVLWRCVNTSCKALNSNQVKKCAKCNTSNTTDGRYWMCEMCFYAENSFTSIKCSRCGRSKLTVKKQAIENGSESSGEERGWTCPKCTLINEASSNECAACQYSSSLIESCVSQTDVKSNEERNAKKIRDEINTICGQINQLFLDDAFKPNEASLYGVNHRTGFSRGQPIRWLRPEDIPCTSSAEKHLLWRVMDNPRPSDICQGTLGDCWLLSALSVLTEKPQLLEEVMITKEFSRWGVYQVRLCRDGQWTTVTIDDYLPCTDDKQMIYSSARRRQLWVPLIEKAMAKLYGSYDALQAGKCLEGLSTLTGAACESIELQAPSGSITSRSSGESQETPPVDKDEIWARILSSREAGYLMGASCGAGNMKANDDIYQAVGLRPRHAYSILDVKFVGDNRLLCLRNPWGNYSWRGDWCEHSHKWSALTERDRRDMKAANSSDGVFWMSIDDMLIYFDSIDICKLRPNWPEPLRLDHRLPSRGDQENQVFEIKLEKTTEVEITLFQPDERGLRRGCLMDLCVMIFHGTAEHQGRLVESSRRRLRKFMSCSKMLEPGEYVVVTAAFNHWREDGHRADCRLVIHSQNCINVNIVQAPPFILADSLWRLAEVKGTIYEGGEGMTGYYLSDGWSGMILVVQNTEWDKFLDLQAFFEGSWNVVTTRGSHTTSDVIPPRHRQVVSVVTQLEVSDTYRVSHRLLHHKKKMYGSMNYSEHDPPLYEWLVNLHTPRPVPDWVV